MSPSNWMTGTVVFESVYYSGMIGMAAKALYIDGGPSRPARQPYLAWWALPCEATAAPEVMEDG